jgi:hypothetical protein
VPQKLKGKFYRTAIRPAMLYGVECWPTKKVTCPAVECSRDAYVALFCGHTRRVRVRIDDIQDRVGWHQLRRN